MTVVLTDRKPLVGDLDNEERLQRDLEELFVKFKVGTESTCLMGSCSRSDRSSI